MTALASTSASALSRPSSITPLRRTVLGSLNTSSVAQHLNCYNRTQEYSLNQLISGWRAQARLQRPVARTQLRNVRSMAGMMPDSMEPTAVVMPKPPSPATEPTEEPDFSPAPYGFNYNAERLNSRAAMIGFFALLLLEAVAGKGLFELVGIEVGNGIDIGF